MKKIILFATLLILMCGSMFAQERTLTFTSITDAKFFVYLNGKLQNERSTGMITLKNLEDKEYHVRIVIDDPYEVATTTKIRPDEKGSEYTVRFNAVRERIYLKKSDSSKNRSEENIWKENNTEYKSSVSSEPETPRKRTSIRKNDYQDTSNQRIVNSLRVIIEQ